MICVVMQTSKLEGELAIGSDQVAVGARRHAVDEYGRGAKKSWQMRRKRLAACSLLSHYFIEMIRNLR